MKTGRRRKLTPTQEELEFIRNLGKFSRATHLCRADLLTQYISAAQNRTNWDRIQKARVIKFAENELMREQK